MRWGTRKRAGTYAIALWVVAFLVTALLSSLNISVQSIPAVVVLLLVALYVNWVLATRLHLISISQGLVIGLFWLLTNVLLDYLVIVVGFMGGNLSFFSLWVVWGRYLSLLVVPIIVAARRHTG